MAGLRSESRKPFPVFCCVLVALSLLQILGCGNNSGGSNSNTPPIPVPSISNLAPSSGSVGATVTITGTNFGSSQGGSTVTFNGAAAAVTSWSATSIAVTVPNGATTGNVVVTVGGQASNGVNFTVTPPAPVITSVSPGSGLVGAAVTILGTNFGSSQSGSTVTFNGKSAAVTSWSATSIAVTVPNAATTGNVVVTVGGQASNGVNFTVTAPPNITVSVSPKRAGVVIMQGLPVTATTNDNAGVTWSATGSNCAGSACGTFMNSTTLTPTYIAPSSAGVYTVSATSNSDGTKSAALTVGVTDLSGVTTYHNNISRNGANAQEYALTTSTVTTSTFGKLFSCQTDGAIYAQPLWIPQVSFGPVKHNVVVVATQHDSLYAFDADTAPCTTLWQVNLIPPGETSVPSSGSNRLVGGGYGDITPEVGVTGTPVIDLSSKTVYVVSKSVVPSGPTFYQRLHAIDLLTGNEKVSGPVPSPVPISGIYPGTGDGTTITTFLPGPENQRCGLALNGGVVYIAWASHEDQPPYYGWVMGYDASTLLQTAVLNVTPNVGFGGIWMSGGAPAIDSSGNLYLITGNADFDVTNTTAPNNDYGDSFLKLTTALTVSQYFTPSDEASDNHGDMDFGAGGAAILVDLPANGSNPTHLVIGGGKDSYLYLLNRDNMGGFGDGNAWQRFSIDPVNVPPILATGAFWNNNFYLAGAGAKLQAYAFNVSTALMTTAPTSTSSSTFGSPGGSTPSVSSSGTSNGIVWGLDNALYCTQQSTGCGATVLHAYDATNLATELWNSSQAAGSRDKAGNAVKFTVPTVANGKVYVGTRGNNTGGDTSSTTVPGELEIYGLLPN
jgi:hypothetical protein